MNPLGVPDFFLFRKNQKWTKSGLKVDIRGNGLVCMPHGTASDKKEVLPWESRFTGGFQRSL
jgi:hypothetical protein